MVIWQLNTFIEKIKNFFQKIEIAPIAFDLILILILLKIKYLHKIFRTLREQTEEEMYTILKDIQP